MLDDDTPPFEITHAETLDKELLHKSIALESVYEQAAFEIRLGRLDGENTAYVVSLSVIQVHLLQSLHSSLSSKQ